MTLPVVRCRDRSAATTTRRRNLGFAHTKRLQTAGSAVNATSYNYMFAGFAVRRQFGYNWGAFLGYQWNDQIFDTC